MSEKETSQPDSELGPESDEAMTPSERRGDTRHLACFPAHLETATGVPRSALIRDLSVSGALLLTRARLAIGDTVKLSLYLREGARASSPSRRRVWCARSEADEARWSTPWTKAMAVQFDQLLPDLEEEAQGPRRPPGRPLAAARLPLPASPWSASSSRRGRSCLAAALGTAAHRAAPVRPEAVPRGELRAEDDPAEVLYTLAERFKTQGNAAARTETLRYLVSRYPESRFSLQAALARSGRDVRPPPPIQPRRASEVSKGILRRPLPTAGGLDYGVRGAARSRPSPPSSGSR